MLYYPIKDIWETNQECILSHVFKVNLRQCDVLLSNRFFPLLVDGSPFDVVMFKEHVMNIGNVIFIRRGMYELWQHLLDVDITYAYPEWYSVFSKQKMICGTRL